MGMNKWREALMNDLKKGYAHQNLLAQTESGQWM